VRDHQVKHRNARQLPDRLHNVGPGWHPLLLRLHTRLCARDADYQVEHLKEKLGAVRVQIAATSRPPDPDIRGLVQAAEEQSAAVCEFCGAAGRRRHRGDVPHGWIKAVCHPCHDAWSRHTIMILNGAVRRRGQ